MRHIYRYDLVDGHVIVTDGSSRLLIDTGTPSSAGDVAPLPFAGKKHEVASDYLGVTPASLSECVGVRINALIGADILNQYDMTIDPSASTVVLADEPQSFEGESLALDDFMGVPILQASIAGQTIRMFFDTGAKLSYLDPDISRTFPDDGPEEDFYPGVGQFQTDTHRVPIRIGAEEIVLRVGTLPQLLQMALVMAETDGILGTAILQKYSICFAPRRGILIIRRTEM